MSKLKQLARDIGVLCESKRQAYGDAIGKGADVLRILYPHGLQPDQYREAYVAARIVEKLSRKSQGIDPHGESPYIDIAGHALVELAAPSVEVPETKCASVNGSAAESQSQAPSDSAPKNAAAPTTPNASDASAKSSPQPFSKPSSSESGSTDAPAPTATAAASSVEDVLQNGVERNRLGLCALASCPTALAPPAVFQAIRFRPDGAGQKLHCCSFDCACLVGGWK